MADQTISGKVIAAVLRHSPATKDGQAASELQGFWHLTKDHFGPLPYWVVFPIIGVIVFGFGEGLVTFFRDNDFQIGQLIFALALGIVPMWLVFLRRTFDRVLVGDDDKALAPLLRPTFEDYGLPEQGIGIWLGIWRRHAFFLATPRARGFVVLVEVAGIASYLYLGPPYKSPIIDALSLVGLAFLLGICGRAAFTMGQLLRLLAEIGDCDFRPPFFRLPHPATDALLGYYSSLALVTVVGYALLTEALIQGPYPHRWITLGWLSTLALYPIVVTVWSVIQIRALLRRAKQHHLDAANQLVTKALEVAQTRSSSDDLEALNKAMTAQATVQALSEWPFSVRSGLAFAAALIALVTQAAAAWIVLTR